MSYYNEMVMSLPRRPKGDESMAIATTNPAIPRILNALGLENVRSLRLNMELNSAVAVVTEQYVTVGQLDRLAGELETKEWVLVPKADWEAAKG